jgi:hypothetical protein
MLINSVGLTTEAHLSYGLCAGLEMQVESKPCHLGQFGASMGKVSTHRCPLEFIPPVHPSRVDELMPAFLSAAMRMSCG